MSKFQILSESQLVDAGYVIKNDMICSADIICLDRTLKLELQFFSGSVELFDLHEWLITLPHVVEYIACHKLSEIHNVPVRVVLVHSADGAVDNLVIAGVGHFLNDKFVLFFTDHSDVESDEIDSYPYFLSDDCLNQQHEVQ